MNQFSFYEQTGIIIPGSILLLGILWIVPNAAELLDPNEITIGSFGLFLILAYALGHGLAALGTFIENFWWWCFGGKPSQWVIGLRPRLLQRSQIQLLENQIRTRLGLTRIRLATISPEDWKPLFHQVVRDVALHNQGSG